jgi:hypothetical protein
MRPPDWIEAIIGNRIESRAVKNLTGEEIKTPQGLFRTPQEHYFPQDI